MGKKPASEGKPKKGRKAEPGPARKRAPTLRRIDHTLYVETDVDKLFQIIKEKGKIKVKAAAKVFGVPKEQIEEWGNILEEYKLIDVHYPPVGDAVLKTRSKGAKK
ncbi:MAG: hypothetical protein ACE5FW_02385 [Candidatus Aenigmatarchaeota archaeon]